MDKWLATCAAILAGCACAGAGRPPNLVVIMTDDMGYADVGFNGCKDIPTPNIDRIARNGVVCTSAYVTYPVCGPSRAGFITGRYPQRFGFERNPQYRPDDPGMGLPLSERTIAETLKPAGYVSGIVGKWHLGAHPTLHPLRRGFDFFYGHLGGGHRYLPEELTIRESADARDEPESYRTWILRNHEPVPPRKYLTDEFSDEAVAFVERNKDKPFFLFLSYNSPHAPLQATEEYLARFGGIDDPKRRTYAAMVGAVDDGAGRVLDKLEELGLEGDTLLFFLSDNGGFAGIEADNRPLRGYKSDVWEGGFRVPFAVQWPGRLPIGVRYGLPVSALDILATIAGQAGIPPDPERPLDGVDLVPYLTGQRRDAPHGTIYLRKFDEQRHAVRRGDFKLVVPGAGQAPLLFNLATDTGEKENLAARHPEKLMELDRARTAWNAELEDPRFLGLIHTDAWRKKAERKKAAGQ